HWARSAWPPAPLAEPAAVPRHLGPLRRRRVPLARRRLGALLRRAPPQLDAVVQVVRHLEIRRAVEHVLERERPRGAVAARIGKLARRKLRREHAPQFRLPVRDALLLRHRVRSGRRATRLKKTPAQYLTENLVVTCSGNFFRRRLSIHHDGARR